MNWIINQEIKLWDVLENRGFERKAQIILGTVWFASLISNTLFAFAASGLGDILTFIILLTPGSILILSAYVLEKDFELRSSRLKHLTKKWALALSITMAFITLVVWVVDFGNIINISFLYYLFAFVVFSFMTADWI